MAEPRPLAKATLWRSTRHDGDVPIVRASRDAGACDCWRLDSSNGISPRDDTDRRFSCLEGDRVRARAGGGLSALVEWGSVLTRIGNRKDTRLCSKVGDSGELGDWPVGEPPGVFVDDVLGGDPDGDRRCSRRGSGRAVALPTLGLFLVLIRRSEPERLRGEECELEEDQDGDLADSAKSGGVGETGMAGLDDDWAVREDVISCRV